MALTTTSYFGDIGTHYTQGAMYSLDLFFITFIHVLIVRKGRRKCLLLIQVHQNKNLKSHVK